MSEANLALCGYHSKGSAANVHFVVTHGVFHDAVFCALNAFSKSKRDNPLSGSALSSCPPVRTRTQTGSAQAGMIAMPARHREPLRRGGREGVVIPGTYKNIHGEIVKIDPKTLDPNTEVMRF